MAKLERTYNVPLRKEFRKAPRYRKAKKAVTALREFITKHMKCEPDQVRIGRVLNNTIWGNGVKNPPHHVKITVVKHDDGVVKAELFGVKYEEPVKETKEEKPKAEAKKADSDVKDLEKELDEVTATEKEETKKETKEEKTEKKEEKPKESKPKTTKPKTAKKKAE